MMSTIDPKEFYGPNAGYVAELYERYLRDPSSVEASTREVFAHWSPLSEYEPLVRVTPAAGLDPKVIASASVLAFSIRNRGYLDAKLDPLGSTPPGDALLRLETHGLTDRDLIGLPAGVVGGPAAKGKENALSAIQELRRLYSGTAGFEFAGVKDLREFVWLQNAVETGQYASPCQPVDDRALLSRLTEVEALERFLHRTYPGQTWFSIEGNDVLIPMLDETIGCAANGGTCEVMMGMSHRGRLNVLAHVLGVPYERILSTFRGAPQTLEAAPITGAGAGETGDVKYHIGAKQAYLEGETIRVVVTLASNPSHLEFVDPVVQGLTRAAQDRRDLPGAPRYYPKAALPILMHGDAAFSGEGIVAETLNLSRLRGYSTGGTIHFIVNNQLGFTTDQTAMRSTLFASDSAKGFDVPIVHVNADDPRACLAVTRLAYTYREEFHRDFVIDLVGYRRYGHNEADEPSFTQPRMYEAIRQQPTVREIFARDLAQQGIVSLDEAESMMAAGYARLQAARGAPHHKEILQAASERSSVPLLEPSQIRTAVPGPLLNSLNDALLTLPEGFTLNSKLERLLERRRTALKNGGSIDWAQAEMLAMASLLTDGVPLRLTGEDVARGTFSQRHFVLHDQLTGKQFVPLQALPGARASFAVYDSPLSENAALGFEYGYSVHAPGVLVLWEAQYGDFVNAAQVMVDQFVVAGEAKWGHHPSLVLLLPHGFEGQGPEHSSARLERFLNLAAGDNVRVANCSTAAQYFHLLRLQAALLEIEPRPLILMSPKSLLRHPETAASLKDLTEGVFHPVLDDEQARRRAESVSRLILCSGKVYYDLVDSEVFDREAPLAVVRLELLYPFPEAELRAVFEGYPALKEVYWLQEEPQNMGAWRYVAPRLSEMLARRVPLRYVGRPERASPAVGSTQEHYQEQAQLIQTALQGLGRREQRIQGMKNAG